MGAGQYDDPDCPEARAGLDEAEPQEDADVARCDTPLDRCEFRAGDLDGEGAEECEFTIMDELHEQMRVEPIRVIADPVDGLPHPVTRDTQFAPPFTYETMVCIEDRRKYVEVFAEELIGDGWIPSEYLLRSVNDPAKGSIHTFDQDVFRDMIEGDEECFALHFGHRIIPSVDIWFNVRAKFCGDGSLRKRRTFSAESNETHDAYGLVRYVMVSAGEYGDDEGYYILVPVRPIRERCKHYKRMCVANDDQPDPEAFLHYIRFRNCMMRRSVGGAFLSLRDEAVYACDYRDPPDEASVEKHLDGPDQKKLSDRPDLVKLPLFGLEGDVKVEK